MRVPCKPVHYIIVCRPQKPLSNLTEDAALRASGLFPELHLWPVPIPGPSVCLLLPLQLTPVSELKRKKVTFTEKAYRNQELWPQLLLKERKQLTSGSLSFESVLLCMSLFFIVPTAKGSTSLSISPFSFQGIEKKTLEHFFVLVCGALEANLSGISDSLKTSKMKSGTWSLFVCL